MIFGNTCTRIQNISKENDETPRGRHYFYNTKNTVGKTAKTSYYWLSCWCLKTGLIQYTSAMGSFTISSHPQKSLVAGHFIVSGVKTTNAPGNWIGRPSQTACIHTCTHKNTGIPTLADVRVAAYKQLWYAYTIRHTTAKQYGLTGKRRPTFTVRQPGDIINPSTEWHVISAFGFQKITINKPIAVDRRNIHRTSRTGGPNWFQVTASTVDKMMKSDCEFQKEHMLASVWIWS